MFCCFILVRIFILSIVFHYRKQIGVYSFVHGKDQYLTLGASDNAIVKPPIADQSGSPFLAAAFKSLSTTLVSA